MKKKKNDVGPIAVLSMAGHLSASSETDEAELSCLLGGPIGGKVVGHYRTSRVI